MVSAEVDQCYMDYFMNRLGNGQRFAPRSHIRLRAVTRLNAIQWLQDAVHFGIC